jgi:hypothetical protein
MPSVYATITITLWIQANRSYQGIDCRFPVVVDNIGSIDQLYAFLCVQPDTVR